MKAALWLFGAELNITIDEKDTDGNYDLITGNFPPGLEIPLHMHSKYSETIMVLEGEQTIFTLGNTTVLQAGDHFFIPVGTPHAIVNSGSTFSKALTIASPSGFAKQIRLVGVEGKAEGVPSDIPNDMALFMQISAETGDTLMGPPGTRP